jgi:TolA-binding protein
MPEETPFTAEELDALIADAEDQICYIQSRIERMNQLKRELENRDKQYVDRSDATPRILKEPICNLGDD